MHPKNCTQILIHTQLSFPRLSSCCEPSHLHFLKSCSGGSADFPEQLAVVRSATGAGGGGMEAIGNTSSESIIFFHPWEPPPCTLKCWEYVQHTVYSQTTHGETWVMQPTQPWNSLGYPRPASSPFQLNPPWRTAERIKTGTRTLWMSSFEGRVGYKWDSIQASDKMKFSNLGQGNVYTNQKSSKNLSVRLQLGVRN